ncbi:lipase [Pseudonocardia sp. EC080610-09]|uniref:esterase/lipase family protein n=1 Tax=unclassified Pseudonocardia TaxID=2619320 RepID=UPI0006CB7C40|nr:MULTISPECIES: alpha/beta fold hydrolase [unclassified Pseudonocardia]ALE73490.1 lipase [Pseudonocardia sp. EC080625-04]ALL76990.1 lipase [Pseudonocardia sp. EC080610-09]ALL84021.1 lipase [Pseudonocardia sp. EC080619-01]
MDRRRWGAIAAIALATVVVGSALVTPVARAATPATPGPAPAAGSAPALPGQDLLDPSPAGSNDWDCEPGADHPNPVVLVHGLSANQANNWAYIAPQLKQRGYCVFSLTYGRNPLAPPPLTQVGGLAPMEASAAELSDFVDRVLDETGAEKVDIVGHSEGSLMPNHYVKFLGGAEHVDRYVGMTPLWDGTSTAGLALLNRTGEQLGLGPAIGLALDPLCASCRQFLRGSDFLAEMNSGGGPRVDGVDYTMILTRYDELVVPYTSGLMDGADNIVLQEGCPTDLAEHVAVAFDPVTLQHITNALDPDHAQPVRCLPVGPDAPPATASS